MGSASDDRLSSEALRRAVDAARAQWPTLPVDGFVEHLHGKTAEHDPSTLAIGDLLLAHACARHDPDALLAFERNCIAPLARSLSHLRLGSDRLDEVKQRVRTHLLLGSPERRPRILDYGGRGDLCSWVAVVATRQALSMLRRRTPVPRYADEALMALESPHTGPELAFLKEHYQDIFHKAFSEALADLTVRARNVLRHHYVHGLTIDEIGAIYGVHRSNAARRIAKARDELLSGTRRRMKLELRLDQAEFDSIMRMVESKLDLSLKMMLGE